MLCEPPEIPDDPNAPEFDPTQWEGDLQNERRRPEGNGQYPAYSDLSFAQRAASQHSSRLRYCKQTGWLRWVGSHWKRDELDTVVECTKTTVRAAYADLPHVDDGERRKMLFREIAKAEQANRIRGILSLAESDRQLRIAIEQIDANPWVFNCRNGTLDLRSGSFTPHCQEDYITKVAGVNYDPAATAPIWNECLMTWFDGDIELIGYVQRAVGYSLSGITWEQVLHLMHGKGENGKSTFIESIMAMLGDYATQADASTFMAKEFSGGIPNDLARLAGCRFVGVSELEEGRRVAESLVKAMTGGDRILARFLHKEFFQFTPELKLWLSGNHLPVIRGTEHAMWRRIRLIPFDVKIPEEDRDKQLTTRLRDELPGIFLWALDGCQAWQRDGLNPPESVIAATGAYRESSDIIGTFIAECCVVGDSFSVPASRLYDAYRTWAGKSAMSQTAFGRRLDDTGFLKRRGIGGRISRTGIGLVEDENTAQPENIF